MSRGRRRLPRFVGLLAVALTVVGLQAAPARAETTLEVDAGYDGNFVPGKPVPVRVRISADRLLQGSLQVRLRLPRDETLPISIPVEVTGGSDEELVVALPTVPDLRRAEVAVNLAGTDLTGQAEVNFTGETELVGLLPGVANQAPGPMPLPADLGTAQFSLLDEPDLTTPGALAPLGTIVAGPDGLGALTARARGNVLTWLEEGGRLVVDAAPGDRVEGLPEGWQPGSAPRVPTGRGEVRLSAGAVAAGRWADVVEPTPLVLPGEAQPGSWMWVQESVADGVGRDGGLRLPAVGWLGVFLLLYVALAGPVLFVVLRRTGRAGWTWAAIPATAALFALGAFVVGNDLRAGSEASHGTVVHTGPAGARALTYVGLVSRSGADGRAEFPDGWSASGFTTSFSGAPWFDVGRVGGGGGRTSPAHVSLGSGATVGEIDLDPGGFGMVTGWGPLDATEGLAVTATAGPDGRVSGTLRNATDVTLHDTLVMVGGASWGGGDLGPGEEVEWSIDAGPAAQVGDGPPETPWGRAIGWDDGHPDERSAVNYGLWAELTGRQADPYPSGLAVAAGWSRAWTPPVDAGGPIAKGRTVFTAEAPVAAPAGALPASAVRRDYLRGPQVTPLDEARFADVQERFENEFGARLGSVVVRFVLPETGRPTPALQANLPSTVVGAEAWDGRRWVPLQRRSQDGQVIDDRAPLPANFDPWLVRNDATVAALPAPAVQDGVVYLRLVTTILDGAMATSAPTVGQAA